jgi:hypothetical protein
LIAPVYLPSNLPDTLPSFMMSAGLPARMVPSRPAAAHAKYADGPRQAAGAPGAAAAAGGGGRGGQLAPVMDQQPGGAQPAKAAGLPDKQLTTNPPPQHPTLEPTAAAAVAAVTASAAAAAAEKSERQDNAYGRVQARNARALLGSDGGSTQPPQQQRPLSAPAAGGHGSAGDGYTSTLQMSDQKGLEALTRARLPQVTHLPPHMHVSSYYDHVKPALPLDQVCGW